MEDHLNTKREIGKVEPKIFCNCPLLAPLHHFGLGLEQMRCKRVKIYFQMWSFTFHVKFTHSYPLGSENHQGKSHNVHCYHFLYTCVHSGISQVAFHKSQVCCTKFNTILCCNIRNIMWLITLFFQGVHNTIEILSYKRLNTVLQTWATTKSTH